MAPTASDAARQPVPALLISDFTIGALASFLSSAEPPVVAAVPAPFDQVVPVLLDGTADCWRGSPEIAVVWTRPNVAIPAFARVLNFERIPVSELLAEVDRFVECLRLAAARVRALLVPTWTWPSYDRGLGVLSFDPELGPAYLLARMNLRLAEAVAGDARIRVLDAGRWVAQAGADASSPKLWHLGKIAFGPDVFKSAAADIKAAVSALAGLARKLVVVDLDDTLWGGVVGDVGWQGLNLGGHHAIGEAFTAFQRALKRLSMRGVVLAIVSKNTEHLALEAIDCHPEMVLRRQDFVGWRINWDDKVQNIVSLASELNLGLESVVFIDDNPAERARVRAALPQVLVPEWPADKLLYAQALAELTCFDTWSMADEDRVRTRMYVSERERNLAKGAAQSIEQYLGSLGLKVNAQRLGPSTLPRATQLLNKTNQMNLTTRRLTEAQYLEWSASDSHHVLVFRVVDRFDDYGLTGIASLAVNGRRGAVSDFVLSCRVMGRGVEETMLHALAEYGRSCGLTELVATYIETPRNAPCKAFFDERSGFTRSDERSEYVWDLTRAYPGPAHVDADLSSVIGTGEVHR
jgi:FkbH-like protein